MYAHPKEESMTLPLHLLREAEVTGYDGEGFDLHLPGGVELRYDPPGGPGPADWEFFGVEPLDDDYLQYWAEHKRWLEGLKEKWAQSRAACTTPSKLTPSLLTQDATGLWRSADYGVCRDGAGNVYNCSSVVAKLIEVLNLALAQGIPQLNAATLLKEAQRRAEPALGKVLLQIQYGGARLDHIFLRSGVWRTLVFPGARKGCYCLRP
jgi:hypothetical protein